MEAILSLAFSMHANRGVYAVLLGSGVSRAAQIPTGWEIVLDLIERTAKLRGEQCAPTAEEWYRATYGAPASYTGLLKLVGATPTERQQILRSYFEPSDQNPGGASKRPTKAHRAIAALVKSGHIRVIVMTNFDRLMEQALEEAGVVPTVIATPHAIDGAIPLVHSPCTVVKLHGDYLDGRIKNTEEELAMYDRRMQRLLDRILDEFGLIVCGWSADWDTALRDAMARCKNRRFTTFWATRGNVSPLAQDLISLRTAQVVKVTDADLWPIGPVITQLPGTPITVGDDRRCAPRAIRRDHPRQPFKSAAFTDLVNRLDPRVALDRIQRRACGRRLEDEDPARRES